MLRDRMSCLPEKKRDFLKISRIIPTEGSLCHARGDIFHLNNASSFKRINPECEGWRRTVRVSYPPEDTKRYASVKDGFRDFALFRESLAWDLNHVREQIEMRILISLFDTGNRMMRGEYIYYYMRGSSEIVSYFLRQ